MYLMELNLVGAVQTKLERPSSVGTFSEEELLMSRIALAYLPSYHLHRNFRMVRVPYYNMAEHLSNSQLPHAF